MDLPVTIALVGTHFYRDNFEKLTISEDGFYEGYFHLEDDPENEFDKNAIKVVCDDKTLAYIPKEKTDIVRELYAQKLPYKIVFDAEEAPEEISGWITFRERAELPKNKGLIIASIILFVMALLLMIAVPVAGIIFALIAIVFFYLGNKKR